MLDRHLYMILFCVGILLKLVRLVHSLISSGLGSIADSFRVEQDGVKMKFTQPSRSTEDSTDDEDEVDSLEVDKKLSLSETPKPTPTVRPGMSNVRQHPLTAGLLRQLSDFTSDIYYHIYYTSPSTGEEKKQPLTFRSNTDGIKSFLPIRNAAIRARDDKACGLLCAILLEGCVDDYAGGEVTEEMVANQMKKDFEWTDEHLSQSSFFRYFERISLLTLDECVSQTS